MPSGRTALPIQPTQRQKARLEAIIRRATARQSLVKRAQIILQAVRELPNYEIASQVGIRDDTFSSWRNRYFGEQRLLCSEAAQDLDDQLEYRITNGLSNFPRPRGPPKFTAEQFT